MACLFRHTIPRVHVLDMYATGWRYRHHTYYLRK
nr:MAG TPA: hypothetical protein [Caudoviricetes sp.]